MSKIDVVSGRDTRGDATRDASAGDWSLSPTRFGRLTIQTYRTVSINIRIKCTERGERSTTWSTHVGTFTFTKLIFAKCFSFQEYRVTFIYNWCKEYPAGCRTWNNLGRILKQREEFRYFHSREYLFSKIWILTLFRRVCSAFLTALRGAAMAQNTELAKCEVCTSDASRKVERLVLAKRHTFPERTYNYDIPLETLFSLNVKYLGHGISRKILYTYVNIRNIFFFYQWLCS